MDTRGTLVHFPVRHDDRATPTTAGAPLPIHDKVDTLFNALPEQASVITALIDRALRKHGIA